MNVELVIKNSLLGLIACMFVQGGWAQSFSKQITYRVQIINTESLVHWTDKPEEGFEPYRDHILAPERNNFLWNLFSGAGGVNKPVYHPIQSSLMTNQEVRNEYCYSDTLSYQQPFSPYDNYDTIIISCLDLMKSIETIEFNEIWSYDSYGMLSKKVTSYGPVITLYDRNTGEKKGNQVMFYQKGNFIGFLEKPITQLIRYRVNIADVSEMFPKTPNDLIQMDERLKWMNKIIEAAKGNKLLAYDPLDRKIRLNDLEMSQLMVQIDTGRVTRPYPPYEHLDTVYVRSQSDIKAIDFFESWSFDNQGSIVKEVLAYQPLWLVGDRGSIRGFYPACLIYTSEKNRKKLEDLNFIFKNTY